MKQYTFDYVGWLASSKEMDQDRFTINSESVEAAWEKVKRMKLFPKSVVTLYSINGVRVEESMRAMPPELEVLRDRSVQPEPAIVSFPVIVSDVDDDETDDDETEDEENIPDELSDTEEFLEK